MKYAVSPLLYTEEKAEEISKKIRLLVDQEVIKQLEKGVEDLEEKR